MKIAGIHIVEAESGLSLYSKSTENLIQPDLFSAFLIALKGFFSDFSLGGLSNFASESYIIYLASVNKVLTVLIVEKAFKSDKYFNLAYEISIQFYQKYNSIIDSNYKLVNKDEIHFDDILYKLLDYFDENEKDGQELIKLFRVNENSELSPFDFINKEKLHEESFFIAINYITKQIFIVENSENNLSSRLLYITNKTVDMLNKNQFKSEFKINNISDPFDIERIIQQISNVLSGENININL